MSMTGENRARPVLLFVLLALLLASTVWRFVDFDRDPAIISWSADAWLDPGYYLYNVRSYSLFGQWRPDEGHSLFVAPGYVWLAAGWFKLWGFGLWQAVLLSTVAGFLAIGATALFARALSPEGGRIRWEYSPALAVLASLLFSYVMFARQRVPKGDMEYVAVCALTALSFVYLPQAGRQGRDRWLICLAILGGFGLGLAPFVKLFAGLFSAAVLTAWIASYFLLDEEWIAVWRRATPFVGLGVALSGLVWLAWALWLINMDAFQFVVRTVQKFAGATVSFLPTSPADAAASKAFAPGRFLESNLFYRHPVETILAGVAFFRCIGRNRLSWPALLACTWLTVGVVALACMHFAPLRYRMLFLLPVIALAAQLWAELAAGKMTALTARQSLFVYPTSAFVVSYALVYGALGHFKPDLIGAGLLMAAAVIGCTVLSAPFLWFCLERLPQKRLAAVLACVFLAGAAVQWQAGERQMTHDLRNTAREISQKYPGNILACGMLGSHITLLTKDDSYMAWVPGAIGKATLFVGEQSDLPQFPVRYSEIERKHLPNIARTLIIAHVEW
jgi:hypothetical protein